MSCRGQRGLWEYLYVEVAPKQTNKKRFCQFKNTNSLELLKDSRCEEHAKSHLTYLVDVGVEGVVIIKLVAFVLKLLI